MPLRFNTILAQFEISPSDVRLLRHQDSRAAKGRTPYELWRDDRPAFEIYQSTQSPPNRQRLTAKYWASFLGTPGGDTLFAGLYACEYLGLNEAEQTWVHADGFDAVGTCDVYRLTADDRLSDLDGRLLVDWGDAARAWIQRADNQDKPVVEIRTAFREPEFPGFNRFLTSLSRIESLPASWVQVLRSSRGIYLLTCPATREQYVGSATGAYGFYGRWLEYALSGHGGNVELRNRDRVDYQVSILEVAGSSATAQEILDQECLWKQKLQSREMGLNRN